MGRWGWRGAQPEPREKLRVSRSDSYSDDYRITPELIHSDTGKNGHKMLRDVHKRHNHDCCSQDERCCYEGAPCCSQDERYYHVGAPRAYGPRKGRRSSSTGALSPRRRAMGGLEVVVVDEGRVDLRRQAPCTSCESCDTCDNYTSESVTRIELKNNLFTSPMHTAEFYDSPDSPYAYFDQHLSPVRGRESSPLRGRSPHRRLTHSDGSGGRRHLNTTGRPMSDGTGIHTRPSSRLPRSHGNTHKASMSPSRMPKMNATNRAPTARRTATTVRDSSRGRPLHRTNHANGKERLHYIIFVIVWKMYVNRFIPLEY
ncbi:hypothetical protein SK128_014403 [Halocaridina rubra]|uniref:Uncharacterized protein n=1 Tax=Halocaridina rubra TaxID=373956 RepID=A0AAN8XDB3_HALRR